MEINLNFHRTPHSCSSNIYSYGDYTLSEAWSGVNWADLMAAQGAVATDFYDRSVLRPKHRAYYRSGRPVIKIGPNAPWAAMRSAQFTPLQASHRVYLFAIYTMGTHLIRGKCPWKW